MTLLVAWTGIDSRSPASVYIATDSRITWGKSGYFDHAVKTFAIKNFPAIIGYCGDSLVSQMLISQAISVIDAMPHCEGIKLEELVNLFLRIINRNYVQYPANLSKGSFTVMICGKETLSSEGSFECYKIYSTFKSTKKVKLDFPELSAPIDVIGSGAKNFNEHFQKHQVEENVNRSTSRDVFHTFYQTIVSGGSSTVGVIPQVVRVFRKPNSGGAHCGVIINGQRYLSGQLLDRDLLSGNLQWFNESFEITDPHTKKRVQGAQRQPSFLC